MFEYREVGANVEQLRTQSVESLDAVSELRRRIAQMQSPEAVDVIIPTLPQLEHLLGEQLRAGHVYSVDAGTSVLLSTLAEASAQGNWVALIGYAELNAEAVAAAGISLERTAVVRSLGQRWVTTAATLADVCSVIAVRLPPAHHANSAEAARLAARLRERHSTVIVNRPWPAAYAHITARQTHWRGLAQSGGLLIAREIELEVQLRNGSRRTGSLQFGAWQEQGPGHLDVSQAAKIA